MAPHAENTNDAQEESHPSIMAPLNPGVPNDAIANGQMPKFAG